MPPSATTSNNSENTNERLQQILQELQAELENELRNLEDTLSSAVDMNRGDAGVEDQNIIGTSEQAHNTASDASASNHNTIVRALLRRMSGFFDSVIDVISASAQSASTTCSEQRGLNERTWTLMKDEIQRANSEIDRLHDKLRYLRNTFATVEDAIRVLNQNIAIERMHRTTQQAMIERLQESIDRMNRGGQAHLTLSAATEITHNSAGTALGDGSTYDITGNNSTEQAGPAITERIEPSHQVRESFNIALPSRSLSGLFRRNRPDFNRMRTELMSVESQSHFEHDENDEEQLPRYEPPPPSYE